LAPTFDPDGYIVVRGDAYMTSNTGINAAVFPENSVRSTDGIYLVRANELTDYKGKPAVINSIA
jgi:hypothetical protein